jgi:hypothetical protein
MTRNQNTALAIMIWKDWQQRMDPENGRHLTSFVADCLIPAEEALEMAREAGVLPEFLGMLESVPLLGVTIVNMEPPKRARKVKKLRKY